MVRISTTVIIYMYVYSDRKWGIFMSFGRGNNKPAFASNNMCNQGVASCRMRT